MGYARSNLVDPHTPGAFHCVSRCVRRAFLCGADPLTGRSFEHRRAQIEQRIHLLAGCFSLSVHAYAVMSTHLHLIVYTDPATARSWADDEVIERWQSALSSQQTKSANSVSAAWITERRERLTSLSWFMKLLNEPIARRANAEDNCTGHFWESRFRSQALLDERAITAAMAYVDLNPRIAQPTGSVVPMTTRFSRLMSDEST